MGLIRMDNVGIVVESLDTAIAFFTELGMTIEGRATIEGEWAGRVTELGIQQFEIAMMVTPDDHHLLELSRFLTSPVVADHRNAPVNALGYLPVMFTVDDIDETLIKLHKLSAQLVGDGFNTRTRIGCATSVAPKDCCSDSPSSSAKASLYRRRRTLAVMPICHGC